MLHHVSFSIRHPQSAAHSIARLLDCAALKAPCPPFPAGSWFVCLGDAFGTLLEILPAGYVQDKVGGVTRADGPPPAGSSTHVLMRTSRSTSEIESIARELGWHCAPADTGFFRFLKVWVEDAFLIELMTPEQAQSYTASFGTEGMPALDGKLRQQERSLQKKEH